MRNRIGKTARLALGVVLALLFAAPAGADADADAGASAHATPHQYLRLRILSVVYTDSFTDTADHNAVANVRREVDETVRSLWRLSRHRLHLEVDHRTIRRPIPKDQFAEPTPDHFWLGPWEADGIHSVRNDLKDLGIARDSYDLVAVFYAWRNTPSHKSQYGGGALGVNTLLGKAAYISIPLAWKPDRLNEYFEHEALHSLEAILRASGYTAFPNVDNGKMFKAIHGEGEAEVEPWHDWILSSVPDEVFLASAGTWGSLESLAEPPGDEPPKPSRTH